MRPIRLETASGAFVLAATMPPFDPLPEVLLWGQRFFRLHGSESGGPAVYREAFCWALPTSDVEPTISIGPTQFLPPSETVKDMLVRQLNTDNPRTAP